MLHLIVPSFTTICLVRPGHTTIAYLQSGSSLTVDLTASSGELQARFYDPRTGTFEPPIQVWNHGPAVPFEAPSVGDWVLIVSPPRAASQTAW